MDGAVEVFPQPPLRLGRAELQHQVGRAHEAHLVPGHDRAVAECQGKVGLAHATGPEQYDVLGARHERQVSEFLDLRLGCTAGVAPVELLQRLGGRHRRQAHQRCRPALVAGDDLAGEHALEEVGKAGLVAGSVLRQRRPLGAQARELELFAKGGDPIGLQRRHASTSSSSS